MRPFILAVFVLGCGVPPIPTPTPAADSAFCGDMCVHIGPGGLNCPEGQPVYDSALPGPAGQPNESCTQFCQVQEQNGVFINPKCVMLVTICSGIEAARQKSCP